MSKRIREIAFESGCRARKFTRGVAMYPNVDADLERFAKAIVKECADLVDRAISDGGVDGRMIKEHFGVEND